jgi:hypothetical protein
MASIQRVLDKDLEEKKQEAGAPEIRMLEMETVSYQCAWNQL